MTIHNLNQSNLSKNIALIACSIAMLMAALPHPLKAEELQFHSTIEVRASGKSSMAPDMAIISLGVVRQAKTAKQALNENTKAMQQVMDALKKEGIEERDLQTAHFNISPNYHHQQNQPAKLIGYRVHNSINVKIRDLNNVGKILDKVVDLGVNSDGNIRFINSNPEKAIEEARIKAVENALKKAKTMASTAGVELGKIISIRENSGAQPQPRSLGRAIQYDEKSAPVPIAAGENSYHVDISMSWQIEQ